jgi:hypothetical protein
MNDDVATAILDELRRIRFELAAASYRDLERIGALARIEAAAELLLSPDGKLSPVAEQHCRQVAAFHHDAIATSQHVLQHDLAALLTRRSTESGTRQDAQS